MKKDVVSFSVIKKTDLVATCTTKGLDLFEVKEALEMFKAALKESHIEWGSNTDCPFRKNRLGNF